MPGLSDQLKPQAPIEGILRSVELEANSVAYRQSTRAAWQGNPWISLGLVTGAWQGVEVSIEARDCRGGVSCCFAIHQTGHLRWPMTCATDCPPLNLRLGSMAVGMHRLRPPCVRRWTDRCDLKNKGNLRPTAAAESAFITCSGIPRDLAPSESPDLLHS